MSQSILEREYQIKAKKSSENSRIGLTTEQAQQLLAEYGSNSLADERKAKPLRIFLGQFRDVMVMILLAACGISAFIGEVTDAVTIIIIVMLNALLGFVQEYRTEKTLLALKNMAASNAKVYRDNKMQVIPSANVVVGDVVCLEAGDKVPADGVLIRAKELMADESILTGESEPVYKNVTVTADKDNSIGKPNIVYSGTSITKGTAEARIIAVGRSAQIGKISGMLSDIEQEETPLQKRLGELGKIVAAICLVVCVIVAGAGILRGEPVPDMLMTGITIAIAAIPEGLPATVTISLALAVSRMLKRNALVHKLHSVETLGCTSVICTDKTGTITENKMTVCKAYCGTTAYTVSGQGYRISGEIRSENGRGNISTSAALCELLRCGVLCSNADISESSDNSGQWNTAGDPTETALLVAAAKGGMNHSAQRLAYKRIDEIPFDSESKCMTVKVRHPSGGTSVYSKGAADIILDRCTKILTDSGTREMGMSERKRLLQLCDEMSGEALRVLAMAYIPKLSAGSSAESDMTFIGFVGMSDPPREEAKKAVRLCRDARIRTVMITGDHKNTASAVARQAGIIRSDDDLVITGSELEKMSDSELEKALPRAAVFARVSPADKLRIVRCFKHSGHIVTMTGDGVNDAPAVKEADIGVAMGMTGTDVTRQAADMVLLDDNFATLVSAVEQGRGIYANIRKFVRYLLSCNIGEVLTMFLGIVMGMPIILLPAQILLVNLVTDGLPAIALGVEPCGSENMKKPPRKPNESFFSGGLMWRIVIRGVLIGLCTLAAFTAAMRTGGSVEAARTCALFTLVMSQLFHVFECKSEDKNIFTVPYFNNPKLILAVLFSALVIFGAIYLPFMQTVFSTVPLNSQQVLICLGAAIFAPILQCLFKW